MKKSIFVLVIFCTLVSLSYAGSSELGAEIENTKIYTVFLSQGYGGAGKTPQSPLTNKELLSKLQSECQGMDFIARDITSTETSLEKVYRELQERKDIDGVLIIGTTRQYKLAFTGLPTIVVYNLFEWMNIPYKLYICVFRTKYPPIPEGKSHLIPVESPTGSPERSDEILF